MLKENEKHGYSHAEERKKDWPARSRPASRKKKSAASKHTGFRRILTSKAREEKAAKQRTLELGRGGKDRLQQMVSREQKVGVFASSI